MNQNRERSRHHDVGERSMAAILVDEATEQVAFHRHLRRTFHTTPPQLQSSVERELPRVGSFGRHAV